MSRFTFILPGGDAQVGALALHHFVLAARFSWFFWLSRPRRALPQMRLFGNFILHRQPVKKARGADV